MSGCGSSRQRRRAGSRRRERRPCAAGPCASRSWRSQHITCRAPRPKTPQYTLKHSQNKGQTDEWSHYRWQGTETQSRGVEVLLNDLCVGVGEDGETKHPNHSQLLMGTKCSSETQQKVAGRRRVQGGASSQHPLSSAPSQLTLNHLHAHLGACEHVGLSVSESRFVWQVHLPPLPCLELRFATLPGPCCSMNCYPGNVWWGFWKVTHLCWSPHLCGLWNCGLGMCGRTVQDGFILQISLSEILAGISLWHCCGWLLPLSAQG